MTRALHVTSKAVQNEKINVIRFGPLPVEKHTRSTWSIMPGLNNGPILRNNGPLRRQEY